MDSGRALLAATAVLVVVAAGVVVALLGGVGGDGAPSSVEDLDEDDAPPGVSRSTGVDDAGQLASAHRESLAGQSYRAVLRINRTEREEGPTRTVRRVQTARVDGDQVVAEFVATGGRGRTVREFWSNGSAAAVRVTRGDRTGEPRRIPPDRAPDGPATGAVKNLLAGGDFDVVAVERRFGRTVLVMRAEEPSEAATLGRLGDVRRVTAFSGRAVVDRDGRVYRLNGTVEFVGTDGRNVTATFDYRVTDVGDVSVERPGWVAGALGRIPRADGLQDRPAADRGGDERSPPGLAVGIHNR